MPDIGPCPCEGCEVVGQPCCCDPEAWRDSRGDACGPYAAYAAKRELDEIEAEMGKESMKYVCDHKGRMCAWDDSRCLHSRPHEPLHGCNETIGDCKGKCIPVEPERVKARYCKYYGRCVLMTGDWCAGQGENTCSAYVDCTPDPSWAQRAGMLEREGADKTWFVISSPGAYGNYCLSAHLGMARFTEAEAQAEVQRCQGIGLESRMFRWTDGVQG